MGIGSRLTQRATIKRNVSVGADPYGNPLHELQIVASDVPCRMLGLNAKIVHNDVTNIDEQLGAVAFAKDAEIIAGDKFDIKDLSGDTLYKGVEAVNDVYLFDGRYFEVKVRVLK